MLNATRRTLLGSAISLGMATAATASAPPMSAACLYRRYLAARKTFIETDSSPEEEDVLFDRVSMLQDAVLDAPLVTRADAAAKVRMLSVSFEEGELSSGKDAAAAEQVARWLEAGASGSA